MAKKVLIKEVLLENVKKLREKIPRDCKFCAVVKSNAYGHGARAVVKSISNLVDYFAVANAKEAREIRGLTHKPILILGTDFSGLSGLDAEVNVFDLSHIRQLKKYKGQHFNVHISIDSGMNRLGVQTKAELRKLLRACESAKNITVKGFFSHISDPLNVNRCEKQLAKFVSLAPKTGETLHIASTNYLNLKNGFALDMVRFGLSLYTDGIRDAMKVTAQIMQIKNVKKGECIGYGSLVRAENEMRIAVIDIGYADGLFRKNVGGDVLVSGARCKILNVCMSMTIIDVTKTKCKMADEVVILGQDGKNIISSQEIATRCGTISYEILTNFSKI